MRDGANESPVARSTLRRLRRGYHRLRGRPRTALRYGSRPPRGLLRHRLPYRRFAPSASNTRTHANALARNGALLAPHWSLHRNRMARLRARMANRRPSFLDTRLSLRRVCRALPHDGSWRSGDSMSDAKRLTVTNAIPGRIVTLSLGYRLAPGETVELIDGRWRRTESPKSERPTWRPPSHARG
jgi:hypothetical protein